jgi:hypothetical protein
VRRRWSYASHRERTPMAAIATELESATSRRRGGGAAGRQRDVNWVDPWGGAKNGVHH